MNLFISIFVNVISAVMKTQCIMKEAFRDREIEFYETLGKSTDPELLELRQFALKYGGTVENKLSERGR